MKRPSRGVSADELPARYALRQCKRMYGLCWRNRHWSAPARSRMGRHVKSGSCNMPLRSARVSTECGGGVEPCACGREAHSLPAVGGRGAFETGRRGWTRREGDEHATVESSSSCVRCWVRGERGVSLLVVCGGVTSNERRRMVGVWRSPATPVPQGTRDGVGLKLASARSARTFARVSLPAQLTDSCWRHNTEGALGLARGYAQ